MMEPPAMPGSEPKPETVAERRIEQNLGRTCKIGHDYDGAVDAVMIRRSGAVLYSVVWWDGGKRNEEWVAEAEIAFASEAGEGAKP